MSVHPPKPYTRFGVDNNNDNNNFVYIAQGLQSALTNKAEQIKEIQLKLQLKNVEQMNGIEIVNS